MNRQTVQKLGTLLLFIALTGVMTWPQARHLSTHVHNSDDPLLSIWRLAWIGHSVLNDPANVLNGNIFHPEPRTLGYSDAVLLQGVAMAPLMWAGLSPITVYNVALLLSMALSAWAMWLYIVRLTGNYPAAVIAGVIYGFVPFRFDHYMHLELQATFFLPLALLALERLLESRSRRDAGLLMAALVGQVYCGIYYGVFLATALAVIAPIRIAMLDREARRTLARASIPSLLVAAIVVTPYLLVYVTNRGTLGERQDIDIAMYSATLGSYVSATPDNVMHGWWSAGFGRSERHLFPGMAAIVLAVAGALGAGRRRLTLLVCGLIGLVLSLGLNTPLYDWIREVLVPYRGLRAPARAAILVMLAVAGLAGFGYVRLVRGRSRRFAHGVLALTLATLLIEYYTPLRDWLALPAEPPQVYRWLAAQPRVVVAEVPLSTADRLDRIYDGLYMFNSTYHWQPIVNGYSGFFPRSFLELLEVMATFPDERSIAYLQQRGVDVIVVHGQLMGPRRFGDVTAALLEHPDVEAAAKFAEPGGTDMVFRLRR